MKNIFDSLSTSDVIQIFGIVMSFVTSIVAIVISVITLRQNSKMIEESSRPCIVIYFDFTQNGSPIGYFVVKNFGASAAIIDSLTYSDVIREQPVSYADMPAILDGLIGNTIAPGQKVLVPFKPNEYPGGIAKFDVSYHSVKKGYDDHFEILVDNYMRLAKPRHANDKKMTPISYPLQEISERLM